MGAGLTKRPAGAIIAGGSATRLSGAQKGLLDVGGMRIIDRVANALKPVTSHMIVCANAGEAGGWVPGAPVVSDILKGGSAAAGIHAALRAVNAPVLVVAWDLPFVTSELLALMIDACDERGDAVVCETGMGLQPMCAIYKPAFAATAEKAWERGDRSLGGMLKRSTTVIVPLSHVRELGDPDRLFFNVNTAQDLERARSMAMGEHTA